MQSPLAANNVREIREPPAAGGLEFLSKLEKSAVQNVVFTTIAYAPAPTDAVRQVFSQFIKRGFKVMNCSGKASLVKTFADSSSDHAFTVVIQRTEPFNLRGANSGKPEMHWRVQVYNPETRPEETGDISKHRTLLGRIAEKTSLQLHLDGTGCVGRPSFIDM